MNRFSAARARLAERIENEQDEGQFSSWDGHRGFTLDPPGRNLDRECGYPFFPTIWHYKWLYEREGIANRVVNIWADEGWSLKPDIYETEAARITKWERAFNKLATKTRLFHYLWRADRCSRLGHFGILLIGLNDGKKLSSPAAGIDENGQPTKKRPKKQVEIIYLRPFSEEHVLIAEVETNRLSPRYGEPTLYNIQVTSPPQLGEAVMETIQVHWTRIVHLTPMRSESEVAGTPPMRPVLNRILDIRKVLGSSAEMFWKGGFPGYSFETIPELLGESTLDEDSVREQFDEYMEGLKRYLALDGVTAKTLFPQVADPKSHIEQQLQAICATIGVPLRIFLGTESGHLASSQDSLNWNRRLSQFRETYLEPMVIRLTIDRFMALGVLPMVDEYCISWDDLNTMSDEAKADVSMKRTQALMQYVSGQVESVVPPYEFFTLFMGLSPEEADAIMDALEEAKANGTRLTPEPPAPTPTNGPTNNPKPGKQKAGRVKIVKTQGGGRIGNPPKARPHRPAGKRTYGAAA